VRSEMRNFADTSFFNKNFLLIKFKNKETFCSIEDKKKELEKS